jgi:hypothetical protein
MLEVGDVLMVTRKMRDNKGKRFNWRFFGCVIEPKRFTARVILLDRDQTMIVPLYQHEEYTIRLLTEDEWPDGVCALRMKAILEGRLDGIV